MKPECTCGDKRDKNCPTHGTMKNRLKATRNKQTSEGYEPKPNEEVELRGD